MISDEYQMRAAVINRDAAEKMEAASWRMEEAVHQLKALIDSGYGNNVEKLIELLSQPTPPTSPGMEGEL